jgi:hypothetical protein
MIKSEFDFVNCLIDFFTTANYKVWLEVPNMGQSADIVLSKDMKLSFVEAKIKNWDRALKQCKAHELVADYIYIAIATKSISEDLLNKAQQKGYGIIHFDWLSGNCILKLEAKENTKIWEPQRTILKSNLKKLSYAS